VQRQAVDFKGTCELSIVGAAGNPVPFGRASFCWRTVSSWWA